jgi:hypothetical protein
MRELLSEAGDEYDLVVVDSPPTTVVADAVPLLEQVSGVLVVVRLGKSRRAGAESLHKQLDYFDARTLGVVVNMTGKGPDLYGYGDVGEEPVDEPEPDEPEPDEPEPDEPEPDEPEPDSEEDPAPEDAVEERVVEESADDAAPTPDGSERRGTSRICNRLTITGDSGPLAEFVERVKAEIDANAGKRMRAELVPTRRGRGSGSPRPTRTSPSGNGWAAMRLERAVEARDGEVVYLFESTGSPPRGWVAWVSQSHPKLSFALEFIEEFCDAAGGARWQAGVLVETWDVDPDSVDWVEYDED